MTFAERIDAIIELLMVSKKAVDCLMRGEKQAVFVACEDKVKEVFTNRKVNEGKKVVLKLGDEVKNEKKKQNGKKTKQKKEKKQNKAEDGDVEGELDTKREDAAAPLQDRLHAATIPASFRTHEANFALATTQPEVVFHPDTYFLSGHATSGDRAPKPWDDSGGLCDIKSTLTHPQTWLSKEAYTVHQFIPVEEDDSKSFDPTIALTMNEDGVDRSIDVEKPRDTAPPAPMIPAKQLRKRSVDAAQFEDHIDASAKRARRLARSRVRKSPEQGI